MIRGTEESLGSTLSFRKTDLHWLMIRDGESDRISSSTRFLSKTLSGGLTRNMMENYGI
jgi:hypothetical protein